MKQTFIKKEGHPRLMLFFAGWGSEENLFRRPVEEGYDYLLCFDYRTLISTIYRGYDRNTDSWHGRWAYGRQAGPSRGIPSRGK